MKIPIVGEASPFVWIIFVLLIIAAAVFLQKVYQIYIKKDHHLPRVKKGLPFMIFLSGITIVFSVLGYYWQLYSFKEYGHILETKLVYLLHTTDDSFPRIFTLLIEWMIESSAFIMVGMFSTILIALMWYFLMMKVSKIEEAEAAILLGE